ncbi:MAG: VOC family protein [Gammaproteobacteria bacterium]
MQLKRIHHIGFVVRNLDQAVERYEHLLGMHFDQIEEHPARPVRTARLRLGEVWLVLVQPLQMDTVPGRILQQRGEGFYIISYEVEDLPTAIRTIESRGGKMTDTVPRKGISNWRVADLERDDTLGVLTQICQEIDE